MLLYTCLYEDGSDGNLAALWVRGCFVRRTADFAALEADQFRDQRGEARCQPFVVGRCRLTV
jgi:hypothetical protein